MMYTEIDIPQLLKHVWPSPITSKSEHLVIERIQHALTNRVYKCILRNDSVIVRLGISPSSSYICPDAPKTLWQKDNCAIQEFVPMPCMTNHAMRKNPTLVAKLMANLHRHNAPPEHFKESGVVWRTIYDILDTLHSTINIDLPTKSEVQKLESFIKANIKPVWSVCHNDLHHANILHDPDTNRAILIDYDFIGVNHVAYEIANHWCEYMYDYINLGLSKPNIDLFPNIQQQREFINAYLDESTCQMNADELHQAALAYVPVSHLFWALWGIQQIQKTPKTTNDERMIYICDRLYWFGTSIENIYSYNC